RRVQVDRVVEGAYAATVEVEGPAGVHPVGARASDALNLAAITGAPVFVNSNPASPPCHPGGWPGIAALFGSAIRRRRRPRWLMAVMTRMSGGRRTGR
ncbi:MAG: bifunctional nuclease domain-containing protein, partial [Streptosporangiaceae bacterium]